MEVVGVPSIHWCKGFLTSGLVFILQLPQLAPARVLFCFGRIGTFFALEPETEPVHVALLGDHPLPGLLQDMRPVRDVNHLDGFAKLGQSGKPMPIL